MVVSGKYVIYARFVNRDGVKLFWPCQDWENETFQSLIPHSWYGTIFETHTKCEERIKDSIKQTTKHGDKMHLQYVIVRIGSKYLPIEKIGRCTEKSIELMNDILKRELDRKKKK